MNKKIVVPIVICAIVIIFIGFTCSGKSKIKLDWDPVPITTENRDSIELKVYVENSGSMDAYMCAGSNLKDALQQVFAGWLAYEDLCAKYAPDYKEEAKRIYSWMNPYNPGCFATIARALARKEVYRLGFKPSHMATMSSPLNGHGLYFYDGTFGSAMDYPTEYDYNKLYNENPFKYLTVFEVNKIGFRRI